VPARPCAGVGTAIAMAPLLRVNFHRSGRVRPCLWRTGGPERYATAEPVSALHERESHMSMQYMRPSCLLMVAAALVAWSAGWRTRRRRTRAGGHSAAPANPMTPQPRSTLS
jgi:hypothetical protein